MSRSTWTSSPSGRNASTGGSRIVATSVGWAISAGRRAATATTGRDREVADRDPARREGAQDADARGVGVQADLLVRLAQRGRDGIVVAGLGAAARERDLARVVPAAVDALGEDSLASPASSGKTSTRTAAGRAESSSGSQRGRVAERLPRREHRDQRLGSARAAGRQRLEAAYGLLEPHRARALVDELAAVWALVPVERRQVERRAPAPACRPAPAFGIRRQRASRRSRGLGDDPADQLGEHQGARDGVGVRHDRVARA